MRWPFTARDTEVRLIGEALAGEAAGGVAIAGSPGVGKTRLASEAAKIASVQGCAVEWVRAMRSARSIPLGAFAALLPAVYGPLPEGVELLAHARRALAERGAAGHRLVRPPCPSSSGSRAVSTDRSSRRQSPTQKRSSPGTVLPWSRSPSALPPRTPC